MSQSSATPTPQQRNITLALYLPYAWTSSKFAPAGPWGPTSSQAFQIGLDSAAQLAVDEINNSSTGIHVSLIRFNSWDPIRPNPKAKYFSGGYSMLAAQKLVATHPEIAGVIGETFSSTTTYSGEVFSALKIPFCLPSQGSAIFSNKNKYPYVWRMVSGVAIQGSLFLKLLQAWGVTKVALITQDAGSGLSAGLSVISAFKNSGIQLSVILRYTLPASTYKNMGFIMSELKRVDARYIIITSQSQDDPAFIYFRAFNQSLAGPGRVWLMNFSPSPTSGKFSDYGGINATQNLEGVVVLQTTPSYSQTATKFTQRWLQLNQINNNSYPVVNGAPAANTPGSYDCVKTMVAGMMNFVANNASVTSLSAPSIRSALIPSVFSNTGASGFIASPITLNKYGDLFTGSYFTTLLKNVSQASDKYAIAYVSGSGELGFTNLKPTFYGGTSMPPSDGSSAVRHVTNLWSQSEGRTLLVLSIAGIATSMALGAFCITHERKAARLLNTFLIFGAIFEYIAIILSVMQPTNILCVTRMWLFLYGFGMLTNANFWRSVLVEWICSARQVINPVKFTRLAVWGLLAGLSLNTILLIIWTTKSVTQIRTFVQSGDNQDFLGCSTRNTGQGVSAALWLLHISSLISLPVMSIRLSGVPEEIGQYLYLLVFTLVTTLLAISILPTYLSDVPTVNSSYQLLIGVWIVTTVGVVGPFSQKAVMVFTSVRAQLLSQVSKSFISTASKITPPLTQPRSGSASERKGSADSKTNDEKQRLSVPMTRKNSKKKVFRDPQFTNIPFLPPASGFVREWHTATISMESSGSRNWLHCITRTGCWALKPEYLRNAKHRPDVRIGRVEMQKSRSAILFDFEDDRDAEQFLQWISTLT